MATGPKIATVSEQDITAKPDLTSPSAARMYDYMLGGSANFAVDRDAVDALLVKVPLTKQLARANRSFLMRAVRMLAEAGVTQFLDLGSGVPTVGNVHEIAQQVHPDARVAYVDVDPVAVEYARDLLGGSNDQVTITEADIRAPENVLAAPGVAGLLDFSRPVAVLAVAILHFVADTDDPARIIATYRDACAPGSYLVISHASAEGVDARDAAAQTATYNHTSTPGCARSPGEIAALFEGYELLDPGLVRLPLWRPTAPSTPEQVRSNNCYGAAGILTPSD